MTARQAELQQNLTLVLGQIARACDEAGRDPDSVTLVAVSKTWPAADIAALRELGVMDFGENRVDELLGKAAELAGSGVRWHFLGQIQSKKASTVGGIAHAVHSVDRAKIIGGLAAGAERAGAAPEVFIQVSLAELAPDARAAGRAGAQPADVEGLAAAVDAEPALRLAGVMTLPPLGVDPDRAFARLREIAAQLRGSYPGATAVSAGMSHDFRAAVRAGATHVRIGSAVFGERQAVR